MNPRHALHPDLSECILEDRALLALPIGLMSSGFIPVATNNSFIVPALSTPGAGSPGSMPGPSYYYLMVGTNGNSGMVGSRIGGGISIYGAGSQSNSAGAAVAVGSGANEGGGGGAGSFKNFSGFGGNISSGYNFALNITNNYGMAAAAVGSIVPHTYDNGPVERTPNAPNTADKPAPAPAPDGQSVPAVPLIDTTKSPLVPGINRGNNLLPNNLTRVRD